MAQNESLPLLNFYYSFDRISDCGIEISVEMRFEYFRRVEVDLDKVVEYYQREAVLGNPCANYYLGECYEKAWGVNSDAEKNIISWWMRRK